MERDVIEICKTMMVAMLVSRGAEWDDARSTVDDIVQDCLDDPGYCEAFCKHIRAELLAQHAIN